MHVFSALPCRRQLLSGAVVVAEMFLCNKPWVLHLSALAARDSLDYSVSGYDLVVIVCSPHVTMTTAILIAAHLRREPIIIIVIIIILVLCCAVLCTITLVSMFQRH